MSNELLEKVITTQTLAEGSALLKPDQVDRFISYVWDGTVLTSQVRKIKMSADSAEISRLGVGTKLLRLATEAVDDGVNANVAFAKISLRTEKLRLDWELSAETLEDGLEGEDFEDTVARLMATQVAEDIENVAINGDTTLTDDPLFKSFDGWAKRLETEAHVIDNGGNTLNLNVFSKAVTALPRKYMQKRGDLKFFTGAGLLQDYLMELYTQSAGNMPPQFTQQFSVAPDGSAGFSTAAFGIAIQEVPLMSETQAGTYTGASGLHGDVWLTFPKNLILGVKREVKINRQYHQKKDTMEYTLFTRFAAAVENPDAAVVVKNVKAAA